MSKFKVGDRVRCINHNYFAPSGTEGTIKKNNDIAGGYIVCWDKNVGGWGNTELGVPVGHGEYITEDCIELISSYPEIHITTDGKTTFGVMKQGEEVIKAEARLHPDDEFDFKVGSKLVMERLLEKNKKLVLVYKSCYVEHISGEVGKETQMVDIYGEKLYVGDSVNVMCADSDIKDIRFVSNNFVEGFGKSDFTEPKKYGKYIIAKHKSYKDLKVGDTLNSLEVREI